MRCRAIWSSPIDSAGTEERSSPANRLRSEWICWKTSSEVQLPLTPPSEHMFVLYRNYVRCQGFRRLILRTAERLLQSAISAYALNPTSSSQSFLETYISPPGELAARAGRPPHC